MQPKDQQPQESWQQPVVGSGEFHPLAEAGEVPLESSDGDVVPTEQLVSNDEQPISDGADQSGVFSEDKILIRWQSIAGVDRNRPALWYMIFAIIVLGLVAVAVFVINSVTFAILIPVMAAALIVYTRRPPAPINYTVSQRGVHINDHLVSFSTFKSFTVIQHDGVNMINLIPKKRFSIAEILYFPTEVGEVLVDTLAARLPLRDAKPDLIDRLVAKLRL